MTDKPANNTSRRDFMKTTSIATLGAAALGSLPMTAGAFNSNDDTIKVALIGCGGRGTGAATQALLTNGKVKLVAMGDAFRDHIDNSLKRIKNQFKKRPERVDVKEEMKFTGFDAYKKIMALDVDLVILATPPGFRPIHFAAAVDANKNVFMEKPVATDAPGIRAVLAAAEVAKQKNLKIGVGLQRHHQKPYMETIDRIKNGEIGDVIAMRVYWNGGGVWDPRKTRDEVSGEMEYQMRNWYYYSWICGDHIVEQHIHNLDVGNWIKGSYPVSVEGMGGREVRINKKYGNIFDHFANEYTYEDGTKMFSQCRHIRGCVNSVSEHVHGSKGTANVGRAIILSGDKKWRCKEKGKNPYEQEHDDLFAAIRNNKPYSEAVNGAMSTMTAILGRMATYSGKKVTMEKGLASNLSLLPEKFAWDAKPKDLPDENGFYHVPIPGVDKAF